MNQKQIQVASYSSESCSAEFRFLLCCLIKLGVLCFCGGMHACMLPSARLTLSSTLSYTSTVLKLFDFYQKVTLSLETLTCDLSIGDVTGKS